MAMRVTCECGRELAYEVKHIGKKVRCPKCANVLTIPAEEERPRRLLDKEPLGLAPEEEPKREPLRRGPMRDRPRHRQDEDEGYEAEEEGLRRRRRREEDAGPDRNSALAAFGGLLASGGGVTVLILMGIGGIALAVFGFREAALASKASSVPQTIRLADLISKGPGENCHVIVTELYPSKHYVKSVSVRRGQSADQGTWTAVYIPVFPMSPEIAAHMQKGGDPPEGKVNAIVISNRSRNENDLVQRFQGFRVQGMVINSISSLDSGVADKLRQAAPGADMSNVLLIDEGRKPWGTGTTTAMAIGGVLLVLVTLLLSGLAFVFRPR